MTSTGYAERHEAVVNDLKGRLRGPLLTPADPGFDGARSVWNAMIDRHPALIARCLGVTDVVACVNAAREHGLPLSVKGGGHNIAGLAVCEGGLMLDMSLMRGVWVDPAARVARALALRLGALERERLTQRPTADLEAYQAYVKGRYFWSRFTQESLGRAFGCFQEAAERDPLMAGRRGIDDDGPGTTCAERRDRASLVAGRVKGFAGVG